MKIFDLLDRMGNKVGEAHAPENPFDGLGCVFSLLLILGMGIGIIFCWPMFVKELFFRPNKSNLVLIEEVSYFILIIVTLITRIIFDCKKTEFSFGESWGESIFFVTIIPGVLYWLLISFLEYFSLPYLFGSLLLSFLLSVGGGFIEALLATIIRWIRVKFL